MEVHIDDLEKRVQNLEMALIAYTTLVEDLLPPKHLVDVRMMMEDFFEANQKLGGAEITAFIK